MVAVVRHLVTLEVRVSDAFIEQNIGYYPWVIGRCLADEVSVAAEREGLGYYPALDYFAAKGAVDRDLLDLNELLSGFTLDHVKREARRRLARAFSTVSVHQSRVVGSLLPPVRPRSEQAAQELAEHFAPNRVRLTLLVSSLQRESLAGAERLVEERVQRWLLDAFDELVVTTVSTA